MTGRERMDAAFSPKGSHETPVFLSLPDGVIRNHWSALTAAPWWHWFETNLQCQLVWRRDAALSLGVDCFNLPLVAPRRVREQRRLINEGTSVFQEDLRTGERQYLAPPCAVEAAGSGALQPVQCEKLPQTWHDIENLVPPADERNPEREIREGVADLAKLLLSDFGSTLFPFGFAQSPLSQLHDILGLAGMMKLIATRPALARHAAERFLEHALADVRVQIQSGAKAIWLEERFVDLIGPEMFKMMSLPLLQRLVAAIKAEGAWCVYHFRGNPIDRLDLLEAAGADAMAFEESKGKCRVEIEEVTARAAGRYVVFGNLDPVKVLQHGDEAQLEAEVIRQIKAGRLNNGRFVMSVGSPVTPLTPVARLRLFADLTRAQYGKIFV